MSDAFFKYSYFQGGPPVILNCNHFIFYIDYLELNKRITQLEKAFNLFN